MAAAVVEIATGQSFEAALNERLFMPAAMSDTGYIIPDWTDRLFASGYAGSKKIDVEGTRLTWSARNGPNWQLRGIDELLTTTGDLLKWHDALGTENVISAGSKARLQASHVQKTDRGDASYGYGWYKVDTPVGDLHWHDGSNGYYYSTLRRFDEEDLVIAMLANKVNAASTCLPAELAQASASKLQGWTAPHRAKH